MTHTYTTLPFFDVELRAGFPSAADDAQYPLDLHDLLVKNPAATFFIRVHGDSMRGANIRSGDILIVDRSLTPQSGKIVVALLNGEFTVKRLHIEGKKISLLAENRSYPPLEVKEGADFQVWGVVTYIIHRSC
jgi:DNA polymerase V